MPPFTRFAQFVLLTGILLIGASLSLAQDPDLVRHFDYDQHAPLGLKQIGVQHREHANVYDLDFLQQVIDMRRGVDVLLARRDVDPKRIAFVGHSYNAGVGALLSGLDRRFKCFVLMAGLMSDEVTRRTKDFKEFRQKVGPEKLDALIAKYAYLDQGKYVSHAAPAVVFLQYGSQEKFLNAERAVQYAAVVSEPKRFKLYDAPHSLNADARRDRIQFLIEQLKLKPLSAAQIASIPSLY